MSSRKLVLDLHPIYNNRYRIDEELHNIIAEAEKRKAREVEIICGRGTGQLKKHVVKFLNKNDIRERYHRIKKDPGNFGRVLVYFRWS